MFKNYGGECKINDQIADYPKISMDNLKGHITDRNLNKENTNCIVSFKCSNCEVISTGSLTLTLEEDDSYATDIYATISSSSSIPGESSTIKTFISTSDNPSYLRGPDPSLIYILTTPSLFLTDTEEWDNQVKGYHITELSPPQIGSKVEYSEVSFIKNLQVAIHFQKNFSALQTQRIRKQNLKTFFSNLAGSLVGIFSTIGFLMEIVEYIVEKKKNRLAHKHKISRIIRTRDELFDLHFNDNPNRMNQNTMESLMLVKPHVSRIDKNKHENTMQDPLDDSMCTFGLDSTILFTKMNQVLPAESIK